MPPFAPNQQPSDQSANTRDFLLNQIVQAINNLSQQFKSAFPVTFLTGSKAYDPPSINDAASTTTTLTVTGAVLGNYVIPGFSLDLQGLQLTAYVSAPDTVTFVLSNLTGAPVDLASGTISAKVLS